MNSIERLNEDGLTIILPTLNEEKNLEFLIPQIINNLDIINLVKYEILVIDDSSIDNTVSLVNDFNKNFSNIRLIVRKDKGSLPMSIYEGVASSRFKYVMWLDADGSMTSEAINKLILTQELNPDSVVVGSRFVEGGGYKGIEVVGRTSFTKAMINVYKSSDSVSATVLSKIFNNILFAIMPSQVKDLTSGFIISKKEYICKNIFEKASYGDYFIYLINNLFNKDIDIIEVGYLCEMRIYGDSKTGRSLTQLISRGLPYIQAAIRCRIVNNENL